MRHSYFPTLLPLFVLLIIVLARRPANHLRRRGAISPESALPLEELSAADRRRFERLRDAGVIREAAPGRFYYDQAGERAKARARMPLLLGLVVLFGAIAAALAWWNVTQAHRAP